jgi:phage tail-like protein
MNDYPPLAFHFRVSFIAKDHDFDSSFQEVSGIKASIETETYSEFGENGSVYQLPKPPTYSNLVLKRGIADADSPLVKWCRTTFESEFTKSFETMDLMVYLLDESATPIRAWSFENAFPVSWDLDDFNSMKNEVAIETIELSYRSFFREL